MFSLLYVLSFVCFVQCLLEVEAGLPRPNMVIMLADDVGFGDVEFNDPKSLAKTPSLNQMALSPGSAIFTNMHSEASCTPSRIAILTSRSPLRECVWGSPIRTLPIFRINSPSIVNIAKAKGYRTLFLGKFIRSGVEYDPNGWPSALGFNNWTMITQGLTYDYPCNCNPETAKTCFYGHVNPREIIDHGCFARSSPNLVEHMPPRFQMETVHLANLFDSWLQSVKPTDNFFAQLSFRSVHKPFIASPELRDACQANEVCNDIGRAKSSLELDYGGCVHSIDQAVGMIRSTLRKYRPHDINNTIVVFISDNGPEAVKKGGTGSTMGMKGRKLSLFEGLLRVPTVIEWPAVIQRNKRIGGLASIMDIAVTFGDALLAVTGEKDTVVRDGVSLMPLLMGEPKLKRNRPLAICSCTSDDEQRKSKAVCAEVAVFDASENMKLISRRQNPSRRGASASKSVPLYFYNVSDPVTGEQVNLRSRLYWEAKAMKKVSNDWLDTLFYSFRTDCKAYYPSA